MSSRNDDVHKFAYDIRRIYTQHYENCHLQSMHDFYRAVENRLAKLMHCAIWNNSGKYKFLNGDNAVRCSNCGCCLTEDEFNSYVWNFCPVCGKPMEVHNQ